MVKTIEKGKFLIVKERKDDKFAEAVDRALSDGWQIVNVVRAGYADEHVAYLTRI